MRQYKIAAIALLLVVPLLLTFVFPVQAAEQTGKINGTVYDPDGVPLAGVAVTVTSSNMMGKRQTQTADDGDFLFFGLPPGKYNIEIEQSGFLPYKQVEVRVSIGGTASLDILLEVPTAEETITVTAKRPVVDKERTQLGQNYDDEFLQEVPVGTSYQSVALLAPGVVGGGNPNVHGGSLYSNQYLVDGVNISDPVLNTFAANFNNDAIKEYQIITGGVNAEYGQATGGIINIVTKSGGNEFHLDTTFRMQPNEFNLKDDFEKEGAGRNDAYTYNINAGGPILRDRLWYFASVEFNRNISSISSTEDFFDPTNPDKVQHVSRKWFSVYYLGKLTFQATDKHKLTFMTQGDPTWIDNTRQSAMVASDAESFQNQGGQLYSLAWESLWSKNFFQKTQAAYKYTYLDIGPMSGCTDVYDESCRSHGDTSTGLSTVNYGSDVGIGRHRIQFDSTWIYYLDNLLGDHELKAGWNYMHSWEDYLVSVPGGASYTDKDGRPYRITRLKANEEGKLLPLDITTSGDILGVFLQDSWKITKTLILKPGVRIDWSQMLNYEGKQIVGFLTTSPRINLVWDATGDGKTVVRVGYNRYVDSGFLYLGKFVGKSLETETLSYNPVTGQYDDFQYESGGEEGRVVKDNLTAPHNDEISIGVERELFTDFSLQLQVLYREMKYIYEDDEANLIWNQTGDGVIGYKNGTNEYVWNLGTPREAWRRYWGVELIANKAFSDNWHLNASYTYSRSEGAPDGFVTSYLDDPRQDKYYWSWLGYDRRHVIKAMGSYHLLYGFELGFYASWATGAPYSKLFMNNFFGHYMNFESKRGYDPDHPDDEYWNRYPDIFTLNLKLVWDLKELTDHQIDLIADIVNVLHLRNKTMLESRALPEGSPTQYGQFYGHRTGFRAALAVRYRY
jgi:hypothetical protein